MRVLLVRHGQSRSNLDGSENLRVADHAIELSDEGHAQAQRCGAFLRGYFEQHLRHADGSIPKIRLWHSPYQRTRQTAASIERELDGWLHDRREHLLLAEQQFGIFDGLSDAERAARYPDFFAYYEKCKRFEGKLWPKMPLGESRFEVCQRVHQAFGSFKRDEAERGIETIVVVGHGTTNRAFVMMWLHLPYEWMHREPNPANCSVRLIESGVDRGYVFEGYEDPGGQDRPGTHETEE
jgi:2,3-bisphosphoglycerate-dependent phosphoglycerate mutase